MAILPRVGRARAHWLELAAGLLAALPVLVSGIHSALVGWVALGDDAVIATRSYDVLTTHTPLLGQHSASSALLGSGPQNSLGPMLYWLLALPARLLDPRFLPLVVAIAATLAIITCTVLARRRGGPALMFATAISIAVMSASIEPQTLSDVWNPAVPLMPLLALAFVTWSIAVGDYRLLPLAVVLASFAAQAHLTFVLPAALLMAVAVTGLVTGRRSLPPGQLRRWVVIAAVVGLVCWAPPLVDQAVHRPGNLVQVAKSAAAGAPTLGGGAAWHAVVRAGGLVPWWARPPRDPLGRLADVSRTPPAVAVAAALALVAWLAAAIVLGLRRRRRDVAAAAVQGLGLLLAVAAVAGGTPSGNNLFISISYTLWWASPAGLFAWLVAGWSAAVLLRPRLPATAGRFRAVAVGIAFAATALAGVLVAARTGPERLQSAYRPTRTVADRLERSARGSTVLVEVPGGSSGFDFRFDIEAGLVFELRRRGIRVVTRDLPLGSQYEAQGSGYDRSVRVRLDGLPVPDGEQVAGRLVVREHRYFPGTPQVRKLLVTVSPAT